MAEHPQWVIDQKDYPIWQAPDSSRKVSLLVSKENCGAEHISAGSFWLAPGHQTVADVHPDAEEIYYVVSGEGRLVMDGEEFRVSKGMTVYIPAGVVHQSFNDGDEELVYFYAFCPPPAGMSKQQAEGWRKIQ
jgi:mannose-6-phosphate isomerase-like protein (cupin superfamily)